MEQTPRQIQKGFAKWELPPVSEAWAYRRDEGRDWITLRFSGC